MKHIKKSTWVGLKTTTFEIKGCTITIRKMNRCIDGWKDYYEDLKPWEKYGYLNPIFCKSKNWGYNEALGKYRVIFCLLWHEIKWELKD